MCGIVGILQYPSKVGRYDRTKALRFLFPAMLRSAEARGSDATGVYQMHADGDWTLIKKGQKASEWIPLNPNDEDPAVFADLVETWDSHPSELKALVGHCRKATVGSFGGNNLDNHPFAVQIDTRNAIIGVHNGTLSNHERIFSNLAEMGSPLKREGKVDSEAIFHLLYHVSQRGTKRLTGADLRYTARRMDGSYAIIAVNSAFPDQVVAMRDDRPLEAAIIAPYNFLVLSSEKKYIEDAVESFKVFSRFCDTSLLPIKVEYRIIADRDYRIFDLNREVPEENIGWKTFDLLADVGGLNLTSHAAPEAGWGNYAATLPAKNPPLQGTSVQPYQAKTSKTLPPTETTPPPTPATVTKSPEKTEVGAKTVTEVEVPDTEICSSEEAALAIIEARYLGLCPLFESEAELAASLGVTQTSLSAMSKATTANAVSESAFSQGYALGLKDSQKTVEGIQMKARSLSKKMAVVAEKKKGAQDRIWEFRQLLVAREVLERVNYAASDDNLYLVLTKAMGVPEDRVEEILKIQAKLSGDNSVARAEDIALNILLPNPDMAMFTEDSE